MIPTLFFFDFHVDLEVLFQPRYLMNYIYLGICASATCFATWNYAVKELGAVKTSIYIYLIPVITIVASTLILKEPVTWMSAVGTILAILGLVLSEYKGKTKDEE